MEPVCVTLSRIDEHILTITDIIWTHVQLPQIILCHNRADEIKYDAWRNIQMRLKEPVLVQMLSLCMSTFDFCHQQFYVRICFHFMTYFACQHAKMQQTFAPEVLYYLKFT